MPFRNDASSHSPHPQRIAFDNFELDLRSGEIRKNGTRVRLQAQPFQLLVLLLENAGDVVSREEVCRELWPADTFVDFDHSLAAAVNKIREALNDDADKPRFLETLPKRGYRFICPIQFPVASPPLPAVPAAQSSNDSAGGAEGASPEASGGVRRLSNTKTPPLIEASPVQSGHRMQSPPSDAAPRARFRRVGVTLAAISVTIVAIAAIAWRVSRRSDTPRQSKPQIRSLAVLPLTNLSSDADQDYFADGMTEALITDLGKIGSLRVISRTSVMQYKGTKKPLPEIARDLNVDAIIEGTVSRAGNHLRITANLLQASPEQHLWAETYDSEVADALTVQGELAQAVAGEIQVTLTQKEQNLLSPARPTNPDAQDLYFRGRYVNRGTKETQEKAIRYFQRAIEKDPGYAAPYADLAVVYANWVPGANRPLDRIPKAREFALKALSLDNGVGDAHFALGMVALFYDWDWTTAEKELERELELNPNHVPAREGRARALVTRSKTEEAVAEAKRSLGLTPFVGQWDYPTWVFILSRRYDLARERAEEMVELEPNVPWGHFELAQVYEQEGRADDGAREFLRADELFGMDPKELEKLKQAMENDGAKGYWKRRVESYRESAKSEYVPPVMMAMACLRIGDKQCAYEWLDKGFHERDDLMINLKVEPVFDSLHKDQRFQALVRRVGIPEQNP